MNLAPSHFAAVLLFATFVSVVFGITQRSTTRAMVRHGAFCFAMFLAAVVAGSWLMWAIKH
ncbi:MAG TPA: hypothetical protein VGD59_09680 [Acidisarcina sp.]